MTAIFPEPDVTSKFPVDVKSTALLDMVKVLVAVTVAAPLVVIVAPEESTVNRFEDAVPKATDPGFVAPKLPDSIKTDPPA